MAFADNVVLAQLNVSFIFFLRCLVCGFYLSKLVSATEFLG